MKRRQVLSAAALFAGRALPAAPTPTTGEEVLKLVRWSQALQNLKQLKGQLRKDGSRYPLELSMTQGVIRFVFRNPNEILNLELGDRGAQLTRITAGARTEVSKANASALIRNTDLSFEDLSMRFLYWPGAQIVSKDSIMFQKCWQVRVTSPDRNDPYQTVDIWVGKSSGAMMRMDAFNAQGRKVKQFLVRKVQDSPKGEGCILKQMRVESFNPEDGKAMGQTYIEIDKPE